MIAPFNVEFPDMQATVQIAWDSNSERYDVTCGTTYLGNAPTTDEAIKVARDFFTELMS